MNTKSFFYQLYLMRKSGLPVAYLGTAFPITRDGGLLTCRHVVDVERQDPGEYIAVYDSEMSSFKAISEPRYHPSGTLDLAFLPNALNRTKQEYFPILSPEKLKIGEDVYSFGYYSINRDPNQVTQGYFAGRIVNISTAPKLSEAYILTLPYPFIEGMSGSPVLTYHNGPKIVGVGFGNRQHRVVASEVLEYKDTQCEYKESINRIVEYGQAYHSFSIIHFLISVSVDGFLISDKNEQIPGLE